jgi:hypothetical protein
MLNSGEEDIRRFSIALQHMISMARANPLSAYLQVGRDVVELRSEEEKKKHSSPQDRTYECSGAVVIGAFSHI